MTSPTGQPASPPVPPPDAIRREEAADAAKTADAAPAPVRSPRERKVLVRDAHGNDPHGGDPHGPDGERGEDEVGEAPYDRPDPLVPALEKAKADADGDADADVDKP